MTKRTQHPMPAQGGSYIRAKDGSLIPAVPPTEPDLPDEPDAAADLPVSTQSAKEA